MVMIAASRAWAVSTLRLAFVDESFSHSGCSSRSCGQAPLPRQRGAALLPPSRSSSRPGCRQARSTLGYRVVWGLQWWQTLKGPSLLLRSATSWAANGTCWALYMECTSNNLGAPLDDRMLIAASEGEQEVLERKISLRCSSGSSNA